MKSFVINNSVLLKTAVLVLSLNLSNAAIACHHEGKGERECGGEYCDYKPKKVAHLAKKLGLNDDQKASVQAIMAEAKEHKMALRKATHEKIKAVLNEEQLEKFESMHQHKHHHKKEGHTHEEHSDHSGHGNGHKHGDHGHESHGEKKGKAKGKEKSE